MFFLRQQLKDRRRGDDGIAHVHVIGAGAMGAEIAAMAAIQGKTVTLGDVETEPLGRAIKQAGEICKDKHLQRHRNPRCAGPADARSRRVWHRPTPI